MAKIHLSLLLAAALGAGTVYAQGDVTSALTPASQADLDQLKAEVSAGETAHSDLTAEITQLKQELAEIEQQKAQLNAEVENLKHELNELK